MSPSCLVADDQDLGGLVRRAAFVQQSPLATERVIHDLPVQPYEERLVDSHVAGTLRETAEDLLLALAIPQSSGLRPLRFSDLVHEPQTFRQCLDDAPVHSVQLLPDISQRVRHGSSRLLGGTKKPARSVERVMRLPYCRVY